MRNSLSQQGENSQPQSRINVQRMGDESHRDSDSKVRIDLASKDEGGGDEEGVKFARGDMSRASQEESKLAKNVGTELKKDENYEKEDQDANKGEFAMGASSFLQDDEDDDYFQHTSNNQQELTTGLGLQYNDSSEDAKKRFMYAR